MNCKPGDLAVLVRVNEETKDNLGRLFEVLRHERPSTYIRAFGISRPVPRWWCRAIGGKVRNWSGAYFEELAIPDFALLPIRDPGEDARDETLSWKPVPKEDNLSTEDAEVLIEALRQWAKETA